MCLPLPAVAAANGKIIMNERAVIKVRDTARQLCVMVTDGFF